MDKSFFPYGDKSKEFLIKRTLYLCQFLQNKVDKIILACNTLSLIALPFIKCFYDNVTGVFDFFIPHIDDRTAILGSKATINILKSYYPNNNLIDGSNLIFMIENNINIKAEIDIINKNIFNSDKLILGCTHFIDLDEKLFIKNVVKNEDI